MLEQDAREFGLHLRQGGWRLGLLVARNVEKGKGQSERGSRHNDRYDEKVSAQKFARLSGTTAPRVLRYLDAWERAAEANVVPPASDLAPDAEPDLDVESLPKWDGEDGFFDASSAGGSPNSHARRVLREEPVTVASEIATGISTVVGAFSDDELEQVVEAATEETIRRHVPNARPRPRPTEPRPEDQGWLPAKLLGQAVLAAWRAWSRVQDDTPPDADIQEYCAELAHKLEGYGQAIAAMMEDEAAPFTTDELESWIAEGVEG